MKFELYSSATLKIDVPDYGLKKGDIVTLVEFLQGDNLLPNAYVCEVFNAIGDTIAIYTVAEDELAPLSKNEILHTRLLETA